MILRSYRFAVKLHFDLEDNTTELKVLIRQSYRLHRQLGGRLVAVEPGKGERRNNKVIMLR